VLSISLSPPDVGKEDEVDAVNRQKRDVFDAKYVLSGGRDSSGKRFDPFRFGSSDRFSHGFGKRHISNSAATASVRLTLEICLFNYLITCWPALW